MVAIAVANALKTVPLRRRGGDPTPGGASDVLLLANGTDGLLLVDGTSFLKLASSS
jgi:hypothetical protein